MAIHQRDRNFHRYLAEIEIDVIPLKFIRDITCHLEDGSSVTLSEGDFNPDDIENNHTENVLRNLDYFDNVIDVKIRIDYTRVEEIVSATVSTMLDRSE